MTSPPSSKRVLLIGWDAADWNIINPLMDEGRMPHLDSLVTAGVMGNLATLYPELSPMLWTSIATGKRPWKHGVYGFTEPMPGGGGIRPVTSLSRKTKAVWNILSQNGRKCNVVCWWPSHPAEPINGAMVSNHYQRAHRPLDQPWPLQPGTVHPKRLEKNLADLRLHPQDLTAEHILPFVPEAGKIDQEKDHRLETIARIFCDCTTIHRATVALMHHEPWDFTAVYFDAIDHFSHAFMQYHPPRPDWVLKSDYELYNQVVRSGYIYHDMMLGRLLAEAGEETTVILISDHGFHCDHRRPRRIPMEPAGPAVQHRHYGILAIKGPGIRKDEIIHGAGLLDICPTILTLFGLPVGDDMDGVPLLGLFETPPSVSRLPSWDRVSGDCGMHPKDRQIQPIENQMMLDRLIDLGYIEKPPDNVRDAVAECVRELDYNLARSYMDAGRHVQAVPILETLSQRWSEESRFGIALVHCLKSLDRISEARNRLEQVIESKKKTALEAEKELKSFLEVRKIESPQELEEEDRKKVTKLRAKAGVNLASLDLLMGSLLAAEDRPSEAMAHLRRAEKRGHETVGLYLHMGETLLAMGKTTEAEASYRRVLEFDPDNAQGRLGLARVCLARKRSREAVEHALTAIGLEYQLPMAHYVLGVGLHRMGRIPEAVQALRMAVAQNPNFPQAYQRLAYIHQHRLKDEEQAEGFKREARQSSERLKRLRSGDVDPNSTETIDPAYAAEHGSTVPDSSAGGKQADSLPGLGETVLVVSGLPRSGTSLMMQMLEAGGFPVLTDGKRRPDTGNPQGYFELEKVKTIARDNSWLSVAKGKAVKIVAPLPAYLAPRIPYRVIVMERDLKEIIRSQSRMIEYTGKPDSETACGRVEEVMRRQMSDLKRRLASFGIPALYVNYRQSVLEPDTVAKQVNAFLDDACDPAAMASVVRPDLYRERAAVL